MTFQDLIKSEQPILIDFTASWCGPCQAMAPILTEVASEIKGKAKIIKIDVDKNNQLATKLGVRSVPTFMLYQNGKMLWRSSGIQSANTLKSLIQQAIQNEFQANSE